LDRDRVPVQGNRFVERLVELLMHRFAERADGRM